MTKRDNYFTQKLRLLPLFGVLLLSLGGSTSLSAQVWKCTDGKGNTRFVNNAKLALDGWDCIQEKLPEIKRYGTIQPGIEDGEPIRLVKKGPHIIRVEYKEIDNEGVEEGAVKQCRITGVARSRVATVSEVRVERPGLNDVTFEVGISDYNAAGTECCYKRFSKLLDGICAAPKITLVPKG